MSTQSTSGRELRNLYSEGSARLQQDFARTGDGQAAVGGRANLVDSLALRLWNTMIPEGESAKNLALVAFGRIRTTAFFPYSDIDILFVQSGAEPEAGVKEGVQGLSQQMWDLRLKLSPATRTLSECEKFDPNNVEFAISLLDCRYLAGDRALFNRLHDHVIPKLVVRESRAIVQRLTDLPESDTTNSGTRYFTWNRTLRMVPGDCAIIIWRTGSR